MNKRGITQIKAWFLIINVVLAVVAFGWMVGAPLVDETMGMLDYATQQELAQNPIIAKNPATLTNPGHIGASSPAIQAPGQAVNKLFHNILGQNFVEAMVQSVIMGGLGALVGTFIGGNGASVGFIAGFGGSIAHQMASSVATLATKAEAASAAILKTGGTQAQALQASQKVMADQGLFGKLLGSKPFGLSPGLFGIAVAATIFILMYKETSTEIVEFNCEVWQPPIGGSDCEKCNNVKGGCSEYRCKSLGQACELLNAGTEDEKCTWVNPRDVNSPKIQMIDISEGYNWVPDTNVRPPSTGVVITPDIEAFFPLEFVIKTDEPSQCKIDYNLTKGFEEMSYYIGGDSLFDYNHTEVMSLPGPDAINAIAPELQNDGTYTLYVRCQDANGNFNQDAYSIRFKVEAGPDTTAPRIEAVNVPSNSPVNYNTTSLDVEVYVNEPAECKWSRTDTTYDNMENSMSCATNLWEMNNKNVYTCSATLTGIEDRKTNAFYFRCKDQPNAVEGNRNINTQSYLYNIIGTQPLNILEVSPNETIRGSTDTIPVYLEIKTDNGYDNGKAFCYYSTTNDEDDYIMFAETDENEHEQRQDLSEGSYTYYFKCVDLGGNTAYDSTLFYVETDNEAPAVVRAYKEAGYLKIITNEVAECSYSNKDCNFDIDEGISMSTYDHEAHTAEWKTTKNFYIRCKDEYNNQPALSTSSVGCSIIARPYQIIANSDVIEL